MQADEYLKLADVEDQMWYFRSLHEHTRRALGSGRLAGAVAEVLDAGCGTGGLILRLQKAYPAWRMAGIDFMPLACELARQRCPGCDIRQASVTQLPFDDARFDAVACVDVLSQIPYPEASDQAMRELARVLRPGGRLAVNVPAYAWMWSYHDVSCQTHHRYARREVRRQMESAGLRVLRLTHWNALPFPLMFAKRKIFRSARDTSDVKPQPAIVNAVLRGAMALEHAWVRSGGNWAWGTSIFAVAEKSGGA